MTTSITSISQAGVVQHGAERRQTARTAITIPAILRFPDRLQALQGNVCDLGIGGTGFICHQAVTPHAKCSLQFTLPMLPNMSAQAVNVPVMVISSMQVIGQAHQFRVNLQFTQLPPSVRNHIEALIRQSLSRN